MDTTTPTIAQIYQHRSIRAYKPDPVGRELVEQIVTAGQRASTSSNLQQYSVVVVTDEAKRAELATLCGDQAHIRQAPIFMAWCADLSRLRRVAERRNLPNVAEYVENFLVSAVDVAILMQTATLAAESLGLGMCYIGAIRNNPQAVIELLQLPKLVFPISGMTLGWPAADPIHRPRIATSSIIHWEKYHPVSEEADLADYDQQMIETGIYAGRQVPIPGREGEMEAYSWQEHSARRVSAPKREFLKNVLHQQGFELK